MKLIFELKIVVFFVFICLCCGAEICETNGVIKKFSDFTENAGVTFHNFGRTDGGQIDYIFASGFVKETEPVKWTDEWNRVFLSDHYPIEISVKRKDGGSV